MYPAEEGDSPSKAMLVSAPQPEGPEDPQVQGCPKAVLGLRAVAKQGPGLSPEPSTAPSG